MSATSAMASILSAAQGLRQSGVIDKATMRDYETLCLTPVPEYTSTDVVRLGNKTKVSQNLFARRLNVSPSTVHQWEFGQTTPQQARRQTAVGGGEAWDFSAGLNDARRRLKR